MTLEKFDSLIKFLDLNLTDSMPLKKQSDVFRTYLR
jgi:hypothetical protein